VPTGARRSSVDADAVSDLQSRKAAEVFSMIVSPLRGRSAWGRMSIAVLGALAVALVVLPAVAGSETSPTIEAVNKPGGGSYGEETHAWSPMAATVGAGGTVTLSNHTAIEHGVHWVGGPETPACSGIPVGTTSAVKGVNWSGTCTFAKPGTYTFYCTVHGPEMTGTITVNPDGTITPGPVSGSPEIPPAPGSGTENPSGASGSPFAGGSGGLKLAGRQRGSSVHGSVDVSQAGAGGKLEVLLLASSTSLVRAHRSSTVRIGRLLHTSLRAGVVSFAVPLSARARSALHRHRRLGVTVRIVLTPVSGGPASVTKSVVLHA
jgi:plastocyanin